jgi:flagellar biosynthesis/type III secretory pathway protein FliH
VAPPPQPDPLPGLLAEQRAAGYAEGEAAGRAAAAAEREDAALAALRLAAALLADAAPAARAVAEEAASAVAGLMVAMLAATLPSLVARFAVEEATSFAELILPVLEDEPSVELRVSPALAAPLAVRFASQARVAVSADPTLTDGDVSLRWHGGQAERRAAEARAAVAALLSSAGFTTAETRQN